MMVRTLPISPTTYPNTVDGFYYNPYCTAAADYAPTPLGYSQASQNFNGSQTGAGYVGLYTLYEYNTTQCAGYCNSASGCMGFDIFFGSTSRTDRFFQKGPSLTLHIVGTRSHGEPRPCVPHPRRGDQHQMRLCPVTMLYCLIPNLVSPKIRQNLDSERIVSRTD